TLTYQPETPEEQSFSYGYLPNSNLLDTLSSSHGLTVTREYEPQRNLLTQVKNEFGPDLISQYEYTSDALGRRESMSTSGPGPLRMSSRIRWRKSRQPTAATS
ncbi:MAG: hypothetical protein GY801_01825, partial [bacterium]|nr:hypothetical protein [bacterium]